MRATELIQLFCKQYPQAEFPATFWNFLRDQQALGHPIRRASGEPLVTFLATLGVKPELLTGFLDTDSRLLLKIHLPDLLQQSPSALDAYFRQQLANVFALQEIVLDSETLTGFNRHGRDHLRAVTRRMLVLLRYANGTCEERQCTKSEAVIAGYLHDVGNLLSRKEHGIYGIYLLTQVFTGVDESPAVLSSFLRILEAVLFHEVEFGSRVQSLSDLSPLTNCLIVADKTDVSLKRVSARSNVPEAIRDAHMLVNLLTGKSHLKLQKTNVVWEIHFSPKMPHRGASQFSALLKRSERVWVPAEWQQLYRRENIEYVSIFQATFLRVYFSRLSFAIRAMFALQPSLKTFRLVIQDDERGVSLTRTLTRDDYQAKVNLIGNNLFKNNGNGNGGHEGEDGTPLDT